MLDIYVVNGAFEVKNELTNTEIYLVFFPGIFSTSTSKTRKLLDVKALVQCLTRVGL